MKPSNNLPLNAETPKRDASGFYVGKSLAGLPRISQLSYFLISPSSTTAVRCTVSLWGPFVPAHQKTIACSDCANCQQVRKLRRFMDKPLYGRERRTIISNRIIGAVSTGIGTCFSLLSILRVGCNVMLPPTCALEGKEEKGRVVSKLNGRLI